MSEEQQTKTPLIVVAGPTASGKTGLAVQLALRLGGEVISADSMQLYREIPIQTAQPDEEERGGIPHYLMGILPLTASYSVARWLFQEARRLIGEIDRRGKIPIVCGGTGLYISSLLQNRVLSGQGEHPEVRRRLQERAKEKEGAGTLLHDLEMVDPSTAPAASPGSSPCHTGAGAIWNHRYDNERTNQGFRQEPSPYDAKVLLLDCRDRPFLYGRIDARVEAMLEAGMEQEVRRVLTQLEGTARQAIGCKELAPWVLGNCSREEAVENLKRATRRYAKRQLTWFRRMEGTRLYIEEYADTASWLARLWKPWEFN